MVPLFEHDHMVLLKAKKTVKLMLAFRNVKSSLINVYKSSSSKILKKFSITKFYKSSIKLVSA